MKLPSPKEFLIVGRIALKEKSNSTLNIKVTQH